jgi:hypothetical protein
VRGALQSISADRQPRVDKFVNSRICPPQVDGRQTHIRRLRGGHGRLFATLGLVEPQRVTANGIDFAYLEDGPPDGPA